MFANYSPHYDLQETAPKDPLRTTLGSPRISQGPPRTIQGLPRAILRGPRAFQELPGRLKSSTRPPQGSTKCSLGIPGGPFDLSDLNF